MPVFHSDEISNFLEERPALYAAILGVAGLVCATVCIQYFASGERQDRAWIALAVALIFWGNAIYQVIQIRNNGMDE